LCSRLKKHIHIYILYLKPLNLNIIKLFEGLYPDWQNNDPNNKLNNAKEAMDLAEKWLGIPQVYIIKLNKELK
jgi:hypothetical protein